jgi:uncharacterized membrane protein
MLGCYLLASSVALSFHSVTYHSLYILLILCLVIGLSEWLVRRTWLKHIGTALLVIVVTAAIANFGLLPSTSTAEDPVPVYDVVFGTVAQLAIVWLLLKVNLRDVLRAGIPIITLFLIGSFGTVAGVLVGMWVVDGPERVGPLYNALGGMFAGTYTGGSINFNAVAIHYDVMRVPALFGGAAAVDSIITTIWMAATIAIPRLLRPKWPCRGEASDLDGTKKDSVDGVLAREPNLGVGQDTEALHPVDLALVLAIGIGTLWLSNGIAGWLAGLGIAVPSVLILTVISLSLAQFRVVVELAGSRLLGLFAVYLFLCVIGAFCDVRALAGLASLGMTLFVFTLVVVVVHGFITFGAARLFKLDVDIAAVASQANIGGVASALALSRSLGRSDLLLPAVLIGSLGIATGTFLGFWVAQTLLPGLLG